MTTAKSYGKLNRLTGMISTPSGGGQLPFSYGANYNEASLITAVEALRKEGPEKSWEGNWEDGISPCKKNQEKNKKTRG